MYIYIISSGEYSSYSVLSLAASEVRISKEQMAKWQEEYKTKSKDTDLESWLSEKGLKIVYPAGEFWQGYHGAVGFNANSHREGDENAFRLGLG